MSDTVNERVKQHDLQALMELLAERRLHLLAFIDSRLGSQLRTKIEADDVAQEVCAEAVRALPKTQFGEREPFSWLCQIAEHKIIDAHRHHFGAQKRDAGREVNLGAGGGDTQHPGLINMLVASMTSASQAFSRNVKEVRLAQALEGLSEEQRTVMRLRYVDDLPSKAIAERIGKSDAAVRVILARTLKKLQQLLAVEE